MNFNNNDLTGESSVTQDIPVTDARGFFYGVPTEDEDFVDHSDIIVSMETVLGKSSSSGEKNSSSDDKSSSSGECKIIALSGLESTRKAQLMAKYSYLHRDKYTDVFWLEIDNSATAMDSFRKLAISLKPYEKSLNEKDAEEKDLEKVVESIRSWLEKKTGWLLLLSNVDGDEMDTKVFKLLPRTGGDIIMTTRLDISSNLTTVIHVDKMRDEEALRLLLGISSEYSIDEKSTEFPHAQAIVAELECMPLAIDLARAYVKNTSTSLQKYLDMLKKKKGTISGNDGKMLYKRTVTAVWQLTLDYFQNLNPTAVHVLAVHILEACTFLHPKNIPIRLFDRQYSVLELTSASPGKSVDQHDDEENLRETIETAIDVLVKFSLVTITHREVEDDDITTAGHLLALHPFIHRVIYETIDPKRRLHWAHNIASALNRETEGCTADPYSRRTHLIMSMYLFHLRYFVTLHDLSETLLKSTDLASLLSRAVRHLSDHGLYYDIENLAQLSIKVSQAAYGPTDPMATTSVNNLASLYEGQGKYDEAQPLIQRALEIQEEGLGPIHPDTVTSVNKLASLYCRQGKYDEAEPLYKKALTICEEKLGPMHPDTATSVENLAGLYSSHSKYGEAEPLYKRVLNIREEVLGLSHPSTATAMKNLAAVYFHQGKYDEAEPLYKQSLESCEKALGPMHPDTATSMNSLAALYVNRSDYNNAEPLYKRALEIHEEVLGPMHPSMVISLNNLADLYSSQGKYGEAEPLYKQALTIREEILGSNHPDTATAMNNLAKLYGNQGRYNEAESLNKRVLIIREEMLGAMHTDTAA